MDTSESVEEPEDASTMPQDRGARMEGPIDLDWGSGKEGGCGNHGDASAASDAISGEIVEDDGSTGTDDLPSEANGAGGTTKVDGGEDWVELLRLADARAEENHMACLRARAEMENIRRRTGKEVEMVRKFALEGFARDLLTVADNMDRAVRAGSSVSLEGGEVTLQSVMVGVRMVQSELSRVFQKHGITRVQSVDTRFDPNLHQAIMEVDEPKAEPGTVIRELQSGYLLHDRLLRPAMVAVSSHP